MARKSPLVRKQELKLKSEKLGLQHRIQDAREKLAKVQEELRQLSPPVSKPTE
jgi:hypothetical protein